MHDLSALLGQYLTLEREEFQAKLAQILTFNGPAILKDPLLQSLNLQEYLVEFIPLSYPWVKEILENKSLKESLWDKLIQKWIDENTKLTFDLDLFFLLINHNSLNLSLLDTSALRSLLENNVSAEEKDLWFKFVDKNPEAIISLLRYRFDDNSLGEATYEWLLTKHSDFAFKHETFALVNKHVLYEWFKKTKNYHYLDAVAAQDSNDALFIATEIEDAVLRDETVIKIAKGYTYNFTECEAFKLTDKTLIKVVNEHELFERLSVKLLFRKVGAENRSFPKTLKALEFAGEALAKYTELQPALDALAWVFNNDLTDEEFSELMEYILENKQLIKSYLENLKSEIEERKYFNDALLNYSEVIDLEKVLPKFNKLQNFKGSEEEFNEILGKEIKSASEIPLLLRDELIPDSGLLSVIKEYEYYSRALSNLNDLTKERQELYFNAMAEVDRLGREIYQLDKMELKSLYNYCRHKIQTIEIKLNQEQFDFIIEKFLEEPDSQKLTLRLQKSNSFLNSEKLIAYVLEDVGSRIGYFKESSSFCSELLKKLDRAEDFILAVNGILNASRSSSIPYSIFITIIESNFFSSLSKEVKKIISDELPNFMSNIDASLQDRVLELVLLQDSEINFKRMTPELKEVVIKNRLIPESAEFEAHHLPIVEEFEDFKYLLSKVTSEDKSSFVLRHVHSKASDHEGFIDIFKTYYQGAFPDFADAERLIDLASKFLPKSEFILDEVTQNVINKSLGMTRYYEILGDERNRKIINSELGHLVIESIIESRVISLEKLASLIETKEAASKVYRKIERSDSLKTRFSRSLRDLGKIDLIESDDLSALDFLSASLSWTQYNSLDRETISLFSSAEQKQIKNNILNKAQEFSEIKNMDTDLFNLLNFSIAEQFICINKFSPELFVSFFEDLKEGSRGLEVIRENPELLNKLTALEEVEQISQLIYLHKMGLKSVFSLNLNYDLNTFSLIEYFNETEDENILNLFLKDRNWLHVNSYHNFSKANAIKLSQQVKTSDFSKDTVRINNQVLEFTVGPLTILQARKNKISKQWQLNEESALRIDLFPELCRYVEALLNEMPLKVKGVFDFDLKKFIPNNSSFTNEVEILDSDAEKISAFTELGLSGKINATAIRRSDWTYYLDLHFENEVAIPLNQIEKEIKDKCFNLYQKIDSLLKISPHRRFGFELELGVRGKTREQVAKFLERKGHKVEVSHDYGSSTGKAWDFKEDGSLYKDYLREYDDDDIDGEVDGDVFEIASPILEGEEGIKEAEKFLSKLFSQYDIESGQEVNAGLHVHHEIKDINELAEGEEEILKAYLPFQESLYNLVEDWRTESSFCAKIDPGILEAGRPRSSDIDAYGIVFTNYGTMEFRMKEGVASEQEILQWIKYTQAVVEAIYFKIKNDLESQKQNLDNLSQVSIYMLLSTIGMGHSSRTRKEKLKQIRKIIGYQEMLYAS